MSEMKRVENEQNELIESQIARVVEGERDAFRGVVDVFLPQVRAMIVGRSLPGIDVDEVVQRSFVEAYKNLADYRPGTNFRAWLLTIARYQLMAETTRIRRVSDYHTKYVPEVLARQSLASLETGADEDVRLQHLAVCLRSMPESARDVLRRRYESEQSYDEIASALGRSAGAVRKQLCLLRQKLHQCISTKLASEVSHV